MNHLATLSSFLSRQGSTAWNARLSVKLETSIQAIHEGEGRAILRWRTNGLRLYLRRPSPRDASASDSTFAIMSAKIGSQQGRRQDSAQQ
jgi:hypothetical protein